MSQLRVGSERSTSDRSEGRVHASLSDARHRIGLSDDDVLVRTRRDSTREVPGSGFLPQDLAGPSRTPRGPPEGAPGTPGERTAGPAVQGFRLLGMTGREIRMYFALLDGFKGTREAAQTAGLHRATGYRVLQRLLDRGMITGDGRKPQRYRSVEPAVLFRRLELFYRDETEIPSFLAEVFVSGKDASAFKHLPMASPYEQPRVLTPDGKPVHPALRELAQAKQSVGAIVRPLSTPLAFRVALGRTLGRLARNGIHVRLLTDAMPADQRFLKVVQREAGIGPTPLEVRHYSPLASNLYAIDRHRVVRLPSLGVSNRAPPLAIAIDDLARVRILVNRFDTLWADASASSR